MSFFDLIIRDATIVDGFSTYRYQGDVAVSNGKIQAVEHHLSGAFGEKEIDAKGLILAPGFIDVHGHSEYSLLANPYAESKIFQGITTEICGNCGFSAAPLLGDALYEETSRIRTEYGVEISWTKFNGFLEYLSQKPLTLNVGSLVGHGMLRGSAIGYYNRRAASQELLLMKKMLEEALDEGAFGLSTGLIYVPSSFGGIDEISAIAEIMAKKGGVYTSHIRGEGETVFKAVREALTIGKRVSVPVQVSHLKVGKVHWGKAQKLLELFEKARRNGVDATCDQYPYTASCTSLSAALPLWAREGTDAQMKDRLCDLKIKKQVAEEVDASFKRNYDDILLSSISQGVFSSYQGKYINELAAGLHKTPGELIVDMVAHVGGDASAIYFSMQEDDLSCIMRWPYTFVATDAEARPFFGVLAEGFPHPRTYGTYPRVLGRYVREKKVLSLEEAVKKMTSLPAEKFNIKERGVIRNGTWADLVLFDFNEIGDRASYEQPNRPSLGICNVWVNGEEVVKGASLTCKTPGRVLRRGLA